jgi:cysteinyl-tRNA synthetase
MKLYNSLTRSKEEFIPLHDNTVNMYTCGVTVYDACHIGHARSLYIFDVIRRYLEYRGYKVNLVRNITDIDDKIINRSIELGLDWRELVDRYIEGYRQDIRDLGIRYGILDSDGEEPRATKNIPEIIDYIKALMEKGYAYEAEGDVYFEVRRFPGYGRLSGQDIEKMRGCVRIESAGHKRDALDFALWKRSKEGEPSWASPWGKGRPGWHIECSVMSQKFLGTRTLDIHAGGRDLIFPHHENEIAQSEAYSGRPFARYWIHHGLLTIKGRKMSKSLGNFITIRDALKRYPPDAIKLLFLQAHYSSPVDFSEENMAQANSALERLRIFFDKADRPKAEAAAGQMPVEETRKGIDALKQGFIDEMDDDFNTPRALGRLFEIITLAYADSARGRLCMSYARGIIEGLFTVFGLALKPDTGVEHKLELYIRSMIDKRNACRRVKDFKSADSIRDELRSKGIIIEDDKGKTSWRRL